LLVLTGNQVRASFLSRDVAGIGRQLRRLEWQHPGNSTVALAAKCLGDRVTLDREARMKVWDAVTEALVPDLALCVALRSSCVAPDDLDQWLRPLRDRFRILDASPLCVMGEPLAWKIDAVRNPRG
jgi:hypothetical protein